MKAASAFAVVLTVVFSAGFTFAGGLRFSLFSSAFHSGGAIPMRYTCKGTGLRPPLGWTAPPARTRSLALAVVDPDAPSGAFTHWLVWNIKPSARALPPATAPARQGRNDAGRIGWTAPCPPAGTGIHRYVFRLYALNARLALQTGATRAQFLRAIRGHVVGVARLVGLYPPPG